MVKNKTKLYVSILIVLMLSFGTTLTASAASKSGPLGPIVYAFTCNTSSGGGVAVSTLSGGTDYVSVSATYLYKNIETGVRSSEGKNQTGGNSATVSFYCPLGCITMQMNSSHYATYAGYQAWGDLVSFYP